MIIMDYYNSGDLTHYITENFYNVSWLDKLYQLSHITYGLEQIHKKKIIHRDLHSGNILVRDNGWNKISDLGLSKSATESSDDNENYGIIPYMAPEIFQGQKYTIALDIYSFGMIMWEYMTGRRPFWDRVHDTNLIIDICDGLRPPIGDINTPDGYIELMKECWNPDPIKRPTAEYILGEIDKMNRDERQNPTNLGESLDIGPITINNPGAIYKSRPLSGMINSAMSAMSTRSLRNQSISSELGNLLNIGVIFYKEIIN